MAPLEAIRPIAVAPSVYAARRVSATYQRLAARLPFGGLRGRREPALGASWQTVCRETPGRTSKGCAQVAVPLEVNSLKFRSLTTKKKSSGSAKRIGDP